MRWSLEMLDYNWIVVLFFYKSGTKLICTDSRYREIQSKVDHTHIPVRLTDVQTAHRHTENHSKGWIEEEPGGLIKKRRVKSWTSPLFQPEGFSVVSSKAEWVKFLTWGQNDFWRHCKSQKLTSSSDWLVPRNRELDMHKKYLDN